MALLKTDKGKREGKRWVILAMVYTCQFAFAVIMQSVPPVLTFIIADLGISYTQAGLLMGIFALPGILISIPAGFLSDKYGPKYPGIISLALMIMGTTLSALSSSFPILIAGRLIAGVGALTIVVLLPQFLSQWFHQKDLGIAMGIYNTAVPLGSILSFNLLSGLALYFSWHSAFWVSAIISLLAFVFFLISYETAPLMKKQLKPEDAMSNRPGLPSTIPKRHGNEFIRSILSLGLPTWLVGLSWMWFNAGLLSFTTFTPDFLIQNSNFTPEYAGRIVSYIMLGVFILSPVTGILNDKYNWQKPFITSGNILAATTILIFAFLPSNAPLLIIIIGIGSGLVPPSIFSLPPTLVDMRKLGMAYGIISTLLNIGMLGGPLIVGLVREFTGSFVVCLFIVSIFLVLAAVSVQPLKPGQLKPGQNI